MDSIKAQMLHRTLTQVLGEPTHKQVKMVIRELTANLMAVSCPWGHNKGPAFTIPANEPPTYLLIPAGTTAQAQEEL